MKKIFLLFFVFAVTTLSASLASCAPQGTATLPTETPTDTPVPAPTLHPQFAALQEQIAASGERFTLMPDGTVQDGATTIPGFQVGKDGKITITVDGEQVSVDSSIMNFDDEKGLSIEGFKDADANGEWEPAVPPIESTEAGKAVLAMMKELKITEGELELKLVDGKLVCTEVATGDVVWDENGLFTLDYLQEALSASDLVGGPQELPDPNGGRPNQPPYGSEIKDFSVRLASQFQTEYIKLFGVDPFGGSLQNGKIERILIGVDHWSVLMGARENGVSVYRNLAFVPKDDPTQVKWYPVTPIPASEIEKIWIDEQ